MPWTLPESLKPGPNLSTAENADRIVAALRHYWMYNPCFVCERLHHCDHREVEVAFAELQIPYAALGVTLRATITGLVLQYDRVTGKPVRHEGPALVQVIPRRPPKKEPNWMVRRRRYLADASRLDEPQDVLPEKKPPQQAVGLRISAGDRFMLAQHAARR